MGEVGLGGRGKGRGPEVGPGVGAGPPHAHCVRGGSMGTGAGRPSRAPHAHMWRTTCPTRLSSFRSRLARRWRRSGFVITDPGPKLRFPRAEARMTVVDTNSLKSASLTWHPDYVLLHLYLFIHLIIHLFISLSISPIPYAVSF